MADMVTIRAGLSLDRPAAESWVRMERAKGSQLDVNRSTVSRVEQFKFYNAYRAYLNGGPWAPLALHPDESWHCEPRARAVDTDDDKWIRDHPEHGWRFVVRSEKWHAQYYPHWDYYLNTPLYPNTGESTTANEMEITEMFIADMPNGSFLVVPQGSGKPRAVVLDGGSGANQSGIPRLKFETAGSIGMLNAAVQF